jgi:hypothetical protein
VPKSATTIPTGDDLLSLNNQRTTTFLSAVRRLDPRNARAAEAIVDDLLTWSSAYPDLQLIDRQNKKDVLQVGLHGSDKIVWAARSFKTTGTYITLLGWGSVSLKNGFEEAIIKRLNSLRSNGVVRKGGELRIGVSDLTSQTTLQEFKSILNDVLMTARTFVK